MTISILLRLSITMAGWGVLGCFPGEGDDAMPKQAVKQLSVEETLGAVFMQSKHGGKTRFYSRANPKAKDALYEVLDEDGLKEYHSSVWMVLGYIGNRSDVKKLEKSLQEDFNGVLGHDEAETVQAMFNAIGLMSGRGVKEAQELASRMMDPKYWETGDFRWFPKGTDYELSSANETIMRFMFGYALSLDPKLPEKAEAARQKIADPKQKRALRASFTAKLLFGHARNSRKGEDDPITAEDRRKLRSFFNGDLENPGPADP